MLFSPPLETIEPNPKRVRLAILASGSGSNFEVIVTAIRAGVINADVAALICNNPDAGAIARAQRLGVDHVVINHREFDSRESFDAAAVEQLQQFQVDWVVMAGWMRISTSTLVDAFPDRIINLHPSLLPSFKGGRAVRDALRAGVKVAGCSVHLVRLEVDSGPIIAQAVVPVQVGDTEETLHQRIHGVEHQLFPKAIAHAIAQAD